jgi:putative SOS response-associated peptidase YedK
VLVVRFNQGAHARHAALGFGAALGERPEARLKDNARAETVGTIPAFRDAFKSRGCIIPASGFYEWKKTGGAKQPYAIVPEGEQLFAFAGLWENWRDNAGGKSAEWIRTCAIIREPNELPVPIHNRMPVMRTDRAEAVYASQPRPFHRCHAPERRSWPDPAQSL